MTVTAEDAWTVRKTAVFFVFVVVVVVVFFFFFFFFFRLVVTNLLNSHARAARAISSRYA